MINRLAARALLMGLLFLLAVPVWGQSIPGSELYRKLQQEFRNVGPTRFVAGDTEDETLDRIGGGEVFSVTGQPFKRAKRIVVDKEHLGSMWDVHIATSNEHPVRKGEFLLLTFYARGTKARQKVDDGAGAVLGPLMWAKEPYTHVSWPWPSQELTDEWQRYFVVSESTETGLAGAPKDYAPGELLLHFNAGFKNQTVEIGGIALMAFPADIDRTKLPRKSYDYLGRERNAPWRAEAKRRIDRYRKADLALRVVDEKGRPVRNAKVHVRMKKHAFGFGTAVNASTILGLGDEAKDGETYRSVLRRYFNRAVFENDLKWPAIEEWGRSLDKTYEAALWLKENGFRMRGHVLVWPSFNNSPKRLQSLKDKPEELRREINTHITRTVGKFKGLIEDWDVTNETAGNHDFMDILGPDAIVEWYRVAQAADPNLKLTYNEPAFGPEGVEGGSFKLPGYSGWVDYLIKRGAPFHYLGSQAHGGPVGSRTQGPESVWRLMDRMADTYGKRLQYSELDVTIQHDKDPEQLRYQADRLRDALTLAFAHPKMDAIMLWGFWERAHWFPKAALWRADWTIKPIGQAYVDLVTKEWWTDVRGTSGRDGKYAVRGFLGDYEVTVQANGKAKTFPLKLTGPSKSPVTLRLGK